LSERIVVGMSGGVDSSVVAALLIKAIGKAAIAINDKCKEQEIGFLQLLEEHL